MKERIEIEKVCSFCGKVFRSRSHKTSKRYCSRTCLSKQEYLDNMLDYTWRLGKLTAMARNRANTKTLPFDLTKGYMIGLWEESDGCCCLTGIPFELERSEKGKVNPYAPSIDRIVPEKGYTKGNVRLICYQLNVALSEFGVIQFEDLIKHYISYNERVSI